MKKSISIILAGVMVLVLSACDKQKKTVKNNAEKNAEIADDVTKLTIEAESWQEDVIMSADVFYPKNAGVKEVEDEFSQKCLVDEEEDYKLGFTLYEDSLYEADKESAQEESNYSEFKVGKYDAFAYDDVFDYRIYILFEKKADTAFEYIIVTVSRAGEDADSDETRVDIYNNNEEIKSIIESINYNGKSEKKSSGENNERQPITPKPQEVSVGDYVLNAELVELETPLIVEEKDNPDMEVVGDNIYISDGGSEVLVYTMEDSELSYVKTITVEETGDNIEVDSAGNIYVNGGVFEALIYDEDGNETGIAATSGEITVAKNTDFVLSYFPGNETVKKISGDAVSDWSINGVLGISPFTMISKIKIYEDCVLIGGQDENNYIMGEYDFDGTQLMMSNNGSLIGTLPNAMAKTENGYISSSVSDLTLLDQTGKIIGTVDAHELFGITGDAVWVYEMMTLSDGSILMFAEVSNLEIENNELVLFKVSGF